MQKNATYITPQKSTAQIKGFHAHVYYDAATRDRATRVREALASQFAGRLGRWHDQPVGPHPTAMYQVAFLFHQFSEIVPWLMLYHEGLSILVHPTTGDDVADHTDHALWLGEKLDLDIDSLR